MMEVEAISFQNSLMARMCLQSKLVASITQQKDHHSYLTIYLELKKELGQRDSLIKLEQELVC